MVPNEVVALMSCDLLKKLSCRPCVSQLEIDALSAMLIRARIPYDIEFSPGNRKNAPGIEITIYITPTISIVYNITLGNGTDEFSLE